MFCPKCGCQLPEGSSFCTQCGNRLSDFVEKNQSGFSAQEQYRNIPSDSTTMNCPHCGGVMYKMLTVCPHCHGPVLSDELRQQRDEEAAEAEREMQAFYRKVNKSEKRGFWACVIFGMALFVLGIVLEISGGTSHDLSYYLSALITFYVVAAMFYGIGRMHPIRRFPGLAAFPIIGWYFLLVITIFGSMIAGSIYWFPKAIIKTAMKKPILSEEEIDEMVEKGLIE